jgi:hypothetical protein
MGAGGVAPELDLAAGDCSPAQNADAPVIQRMPFAPGIGGLENRQFFLRQKMGVHEMRTE